MVGLFQGICKTKLSPYIDGIIHTKGDNYDRHLDIFNEILTRLEVGDMQVSVKSVFSAIKLDFVGMELSQTRYAPTQKRVDTILRIKPPKVVRNVREFAGMVNFIKDHIPNCSARMEPITPLTKIDKPFIWEKEKTNHL